MKKQIQEPDFEAMKLEGWKQTDGSSHQYGRKTGVNTYEFQEVDMDKRSLSYGETIEDTICITDYSEKEIKSHISAYYNSLEHLIKENGDDSNFIIAECLFEQTNGLY